MRRSVAQRFEQLGDRGVLVLNALLRAGHADLEQPGAEGSLAEDERGPPRRAGLLAIVVREDGTFLREAINVRRSPAHHAAMVRADVPDADVIAKNDQNVGLLVRRKCRAGNESQTENDCGKHIHNFCFHVILLVKMLLSTKIGGAIPPSIYVKSIPVS